MRDDLHNHQLSILSIVLLPETKKNIVLTVSSEVVL